MVGDGPGGRVFSSGSELLPPAVTQRNHRGATTPDLVLTPPFVPGARTPVPAPEVTSQGAIPPTELPASAEQDPVPAETISSSAEIDVLPEPASDEPLLELTDPFAGDPDALPEQMPWEAPSVEPMPWESAPASLQWAATKVEEEDEGVILAATPEDEFPIEAFIIPEHSRRVPTGLPDPEPAHHGDPSNELAERFEKLSRRLRAEDIESLLPSLARGDRFDALVAGFIAGYFSARDL